MDYNNYIVSVYSKSLIKEEDYNLIKEKLEKVFSDVKEIHGQLDLEKGINKKLYKVKLPKKPNMLLEDYPLNKKELDNLEKICREKKIMISIFRLEEVLILG